MRHLFADLFVVALEQLDFLTDVIHLDIAIGAGNVELAYLHRGDPVSLHIGRGAWIFEKEFD